MSERALSTIEEGLKREAERATLEGKPEAAAALYATRAVVLEALADEEERRTPLRLNLLLHRRDR